MRKVLEDILYNEVTNPLKIAPMHGLLPGVFERTFYEARKVLGPGDTNIES